MASSSTGAREVRVPGVCRCCLAVGTFKSMEAAYSWRGRPENYSEMLLEAFSMTLLRETDTASLLICGLCVCRLRDACAFRRQLRECQESFLRLVSPDQVNVKLSNFMKIEWKEEPVALEVTSHYQDEKDADDFTLSDAEDNAPLNTIPQAKAKVPPPPVHMVSTTVPRAGGETPRHKSTRSVATLKRKHRPAVTSKRKTLALSTDPRVHTKLKEPQVDAVIKSEVKLSNFMKIKWKEEPVTLEVTSHYQDEKDADDFTLSGAEDDAPLNTIPQAKAKVPPPPVHTFSATVPRAGGETPRNKRTGSVATLKRKHTPATTSKRKILALTTDPEVHTELKEPEVDAVIKTEGNKLHFNPALIIATKESEKPGLFSTTEQHQCDVCGKHFSNFKKKFEHTRLKHRDKLEASHSQLKYQCNLCNETFDTFKTRYDHLCSFHKKCSACAMNSENPCSSCTSNAKEIKPHGKKGRRNKKNYESKCRHCQESFSNWYTFSKHLIMAHGAPKLQCGACEKTYFYKCNLRNHQRRDHMLERNLSCSLCDYKAYNGDTMQKHMIVHERRRAFQCDECGKSFFRKSNVRSHMAIHFAYLKKKCRLCGWRYVVGIKQHMDKHHPNKV